MKDLFKQEAEGVVCDIDLQADVTYFKCLVNDEFLKDFKPSNLRVRCQTTNGSVDSEDSESSES